ncbi:VIR protein [Plasmodium vivax]|uniref:VIR protein n=1 Tax=Plasmodium vivax TaxID=5855 RepID=A0A1G4E997_PLAVI|nr:VIR protein [Plasmodium vivax]
MMLFVLVICFYPFLKEVSTTYKEFDNELEDYNRQIDVICDSYVLKDSSEDINKNRQFCKKLMRNLGYFSIDPKFYAPSYERCNILYNWIYNSINNKKITDDIINKCFNEYNSYMDSIYKPVRCSIKSYDENYKEPINITLLHIFETNMHIINNKLNGPREESKIPCLKFVCGCLKIYKSMNETYCHNGEGIQDDYRNTCFKLKKFKESYNMYLYNNSKLSAIIPSLDNIDKDLLDKCQEDEKRLRLDSDADETQLRYSANSLPTATEGQRIFSEEGRTITHGNGDSSMKKTITTTIGTFAGASSLLAFLYKFTPAGRLVNPKLRRTTGIINNHFYGEEANGMLFDGNEHNQFNSYNIGYEAV